MNDGPPLPRFSNPAGVDLVNLGDVRAFMLVEDNLYKICVDPSRKRFPIEAHYAAVARHGYQPSQVNRQNVWEHRDPRYGIHMVLCHMIDQGLPLAFLDVGSFVGDVGIRFANFFRTIGYDGRVFCFDPTISGDLIPYNIRLNGLESYVRYCPVAVSHFAGCVTFFQREGHSDSSSARSNSAGPVNTIVELIRLSDFIKCNGIGDAFIKLDTENLERAILADLREHLARTCTCVGFEFHVQQREMWPVVSELLQSHVLLDIGYLPNPFCFSEIRAEATDSFFAECAARPYAYTDVLAISRRTPQLDKLIGHLARLERRPVAYSLVYP